MKFPDDFFEQDGLFYPKDARSVIGYTDGDAVEAHLERALSEAKDLSSLSRELEARIVDWPTRYHLSGERSNLLRCLDLAAGASVLELGAGCGAVTRHLLERGARVMAVEGSPSRAGLCRMRCREQERARVVVGDFFKLELGESFDLVTLIGVLEYAGVYRKSPDPFFDLVSWAAARLRPGGQLLIAIENQFGLKYFSGCGEDHGLPRFSGIEGYPEGTGVRTFGRARLEQLVRRAGLEPAFLVLPFPDYKIPNSFVNAKYASAELAERYGLPDWCRKPFDDYARPRDYLFDDHLALAELARNGLLPEVSNSLMLVARRGEGAPGPIAEPRWIARRFNARRHPAYRTDTELLPGDDGKVAVHKRRLDPERPSVVDGALVTHVLDTEPFIENAESMSLALLRALRKQRGAEQALTEVLRQWLGFFTPEHAVDGSNQLVRGELLDCIPDNLFRSADGPWQYIDREWRYNGAVELDWIFYRGLLSFWTHHAVAIAGVSAREAGGRERFILRCFELLGGAITVQTLSELERREELFQRSVRAGPEERCVPPAATVASRIEPRPWTIPGRTTIVQGAGVRLP